MKIHLSVTPAKAGAHADKHNLVREWMPARLRRISGLRGQDLEMDFFDILLRSLSYSVSHIKSAVSF